MKKIIIKIALLLLLLSAAYCYAGQTLQWKVYGIQGDTLKNVENRLAIVQQAFGSDLSVKEANEFYQTAPENIQKALEPYGFFHSKIESHLTRTGSTWNAAFFITAGPALTISSVDIRLKGEGKNNTVLLDFLKKFPLKAGQNFSTPSYENAKKELFNLANNQGYLKASLEKKEIQINLKNNTAKILWELDTGDRYYFGKVSFSKSPYSPDFLTRFSPFNVTQPFSSERLLKFQQDLSNSRYFKEVSVNPEFEKISNHLVPINVDTSVPKSQQYNIGAGYGTLTGPRLTLGADFRRLTDTGQRLTAQIKLSSVLSGAAIKYYIPGKNPLTEQYTLGINYQKFMPKNGESNSKTLSAGYTKTKEDWQYSATINYLTDRYQVDDNPTRTSHILYPALNISRLKADNLIAPKNGSSISFNLQGASKEILSTTSFAQSEIKAKYIFSPTSVNRFIVRGDLGYTIVKDLQKLPLTLNFFAGGITSVRGYPDSSIGPGKYLEIASAEFQQKIVGNWSAAVFYDIGTATNQFNQNWMRGVGAGIVYQSIIGPVQIYIARALDSTGQPLRVEFNIGPDL